jgi:hypothetical protein
LQTFFTAQRPGHCQKFLSVLVSRRPQTNYSIVAGVFAFAAKSARCKPEDGIEPVDRTSGVSQNLHDPVVPLNVRKLMSQDHANAVIRPAFGITR